MAMDYTLRLGGINKRSLHKYKSRKQTVFADSVPEAKRKARKAFPKATAILMARKRGTIDTFKVTAYYK